jgi:GDP-mannose transporter
MASHANKSVHHVAEDLEVGLSLIIYSGCSISMILLNKLVIDTYHLNYPMGLLVLQNGCALLLVAILKKLGLVHYPDFDRKVAMKWLPLTVLFVGMLWTSMKSLKIMSVAVQTILKNLAIILTAFGDQYYFGKRVSTPMYGAFALMVAGSYMGSVGDRWVTSWGLFWTFTNIFFTVSYVLYMKRLLGDVSKEIGRYGPVFYNNLLSLPFLAPSCIATLPDLLGDIYESPYSAKMCLLMMILVGSVMTFASFWCMKMTSPTTYSVTGALNKIPLAIMGIFIFGHTPSGLGWTGIGIALSGGVVYTWLNRPPKPQKDTAVDQERRVV